MKLVFIWFLSLIIFAHSSAVIDKRVLICGVCKDIEKHIPLTFVSIDKLGDMFSDYRVVIYENNSTDKTKLLLKDWCKRNARVEIISEDLTDEDLAAFCCNTTDEGPFFRVERIAAARNVLLQRVMSEKYAHYPYIICIDLDLSLPFELDGVREVFESNTDWDAVFANGVDTEGKLYDWYAFRNQDYPVGPEILGDAWWKYDKRLTLGEKSPWYRVYSAFGGLGIYKRASILGCKYSAVVDNDLEKFYKRIIEDKKISKNFMMKKYFESKGSDLKLVKVPLPSSKLPKLPYSYGILLEENGSDFVWRLNSGVTQYPVVCEHVYFHASMINKGKDKLYINPRLKFYYR